MTMEATRGVLNSVWISWPTRIQSKFLHVFEVCPLLCCSHSITDCDRCFLLVQAYLEHTKLPISDYVNDTKTVIDQIPRLLAAMQYIALQETTAAGSFELACQFSRVRQILETRTMVSFFSVRVYGFVATDPRRLTIALSSDERWTKTRGSNCRGSRTRYYATWKRVPSPKRLKCLRLAK